MSIENHSPAKGGFKSELLAYVEVVADEIRKDGYSVNGLQIHRSGEIMFNTLILQIWDIFFQTEHPGTAVIMGALLPAHIPHCNREEYSDSWVVWKPRNPVTPSVDIDGNHLTNDVPGHAQAWVCEVKYSLPSPQRKSLA
jgi:hypothetical protein